MQVGLVRTHSRLPPSAIMSSVTVAGKVIVSLISGHNRSDRDRRSGHPVVE
jgi:hypothetical protein